VEDGREAMIPNKIARLAGRGLSIASCRWPTTANTLAATIVWHHMVTAMDPGGQCCDLSGLRATTTYGQTPAAALLAVDCCRYHIGLETMLRGDNWPKRIAMLRDFMVLSVMYSRIGGRCFASVGRRFK